MKCNKLKIIFECFFLSLKLLKIFDNFFNESDFLNAVWTVNVVSKKGKAMKKIQYWISRRYNIRWGAFSN